MFDLSTVRIGILGLGYVGLPLAVEFGRRYPTLGFDIDPDRIEELRAHRDRTLEVEPEDIARSSGLSFTDEPGDLQDCNVYIISVPTPIDAARRPDLRPLEAASRIAGCLLGQDDVVIYESTVYPGATEEVCVPILEAESGLRCNEGFFVGYSPERINPGDKSHRLGDIVKVTSGSTAEASRFVDALYGSVVEAGTHNVSSICVAEAAKVIENVQRDVNIALVNELALIFHRLGIDTQEVLEAAGSKWNFLPFRPGLVGGHCIGVDPYYLTHKVQTLGHHPEMILAGRRVNDAMGRYVAETVVKLMTRRRIQVVGSNILVLGLTFKENCPDLRNTRVIDIVDELRGYHVNLDICDPWADSEDARTEYGIDLVSEPGAGRYDAVVIAVGHRQFREMGIEGVRLLGKPGAVIYDVKWLFPANQTDGRL